MILLTMKFLKMKIEIKVDMVKEPPIFIKNKKGQDLILTPKQMLQRLPIALAQVKAGNNSENLLNEISQILCINEKQLRKKYIIA